MKRLPTEKRDQHKWWKDPKWIITTVIAIIGIIIGIWRYSNSTASEKTNIESRTIGNSSPSIVTKGSNSPVTVVYKDVDNNTIETLLENNKKLESLIDEFGLMKHEQLLQKYDIGYVLFAITIKNEIVRSKRGRLQENWKIDWANAKAEISDQLISFKLPNIYDQFEGQEREFGNNTVSIPRRQPNEYCAFTIPGIKRSENNISPSVTVCIGLLAETPEGIICFIGLKKATQGNVL
ncbi:MAG: hypothetical protein ABSG22_05685 [Sedimentisphaerales bacterium]|jgi:hypothetical protein